MTFRSFLGNISACRDIVNDMPPEPLQPMSSRHPHAVALREVIGLVAEIDGVLGREFGGKGRGIHSKLDSVRPAIPVKLDKRLRYLEAARNKALMQPEWRIPEREKYIAECQAAVFRLRRIARKRERNHQLMSLLRRSLGTLGSFVAVVAAMCLLLLVASGTFAISA